MSIETNLAGRLRNTKLPVSHSLLPVFEAVVNSIHSIEERDDRDSRGTISVEILRKDSGPELDLEGRKKRGADFIPEITSFKVTDNGIGFDDENLKSFRTLDSDHKAEKGCRGIGRLMWLKAFGSVHIDSVSKRGDAFLRRNFNLDSIAGVSEPQESALTPPVKRETTITLSDFQSRYQQSSRKSVEIIARNLFEHCIWYFLREGGAPEIKVFDSESSLSLDQIYEESIIGQIECETTKVKGSDFDLIHVRMKAATAQDHKISYCAANRLVREEEISGKIPGLFGRLQDGESSFVHHCYVTSKYLDENVRPERTGFDIEEQSEEDLLSELSISIDEIRAACLVKVQEKLASFLEAGIAASQQRVQSYIDNAAPRYRPIIHHMKSDDLMVDPKISDKELELLLHKQLAEFERGLLSEGHEILKPRMSETYDQYTGRVQEYLMRASELKKSDLANYVSHRRVILDLFESAIQRDTEGKYSREDLIHQLIIPMGVESSEIPADEGNLWLIDERLAFHNYLASDKTLKSMPITKSDSTKEPDIVSLKVFDNPLLVAEGQKLPLASITVIEIKRPMRNDAKEGEDKDPIEQALGYLERIRNGQATTPKGRLIPGSESIPGFCYILADLTEKMVGRCKTRDLKLTSDKMGYFGYNNSYNAYIEVATFDRLLNSAKERNRAFFDKLGFPIT